MFCVKCGEQLTAEALFCGNCGTKVIRGAAAPAPEVFNNRCKICGHEPSQLSPDHFLCKTCGSEYYTNGGKLQRCRLADSRIISIFAKTHQLEQHELYNEALQCLLTGESFASENVMHLVRLGRMFRLNHMHRQARDCYCKAAAFCVDYATIYANIGAIDSAEGQYGKAKVSFLHAVDLMNARREAYSDDEYAVTLGGLALVSGKLGMLAEALVFLDVAEKHGYKNGNTVRKMIGL